MGDARRLHQAAEGGETLQLRRAAGAAGQMRLDGQGVGGVEFAVQQAMQHRLLLGAGRHALASSGAPSAAASIRRARARRDITVPIGAPVTAATSR